MLGLGCAGFGQHFGQQFTPGGLAINPCAAVGFAGPAKSPRRVVLLEDAMKKVLLVVVVLTIGLLGYELGVEHQPAQVAPAPAAPRPAIVDPFDPPPAAAATVVDTSQLDAINARRRADAQRIRDAEAVAEAVDRRARQREATGGD